MAINSKYKKIYFIALIVFVFINIIAVFFVFKQYRMENNQSQLLSKAKLRYSKARERIEEVSEKITQISDSSTMKLFHSILIEKKYLDSALTFDQISNESLTNISEKIFDISAKSNHLEQKIDFECLVTN